jgi:hypothetical protein
LLDVWDRGKSSDHVILAQRYRIAKKDLFLLYLKLTRVGSLPCEPLRNHRFLD